MEPKYKIDQEVWLILDNEVQKLMIVGVFMGVDENGPNFRYAFMTNGHYGMWEIDDMDNNYWVGEEDIFETKEGLISSL